MSVHKYSTAKGDKWYVKYGNQAKRGFKTKGEAKQYEAKLRLQANSLQETLYFHAMIDDFLETTKKEVSYGTWIKKKYVIDKIILPNTKNKDMKKITEVECRNFKDVVNETKYSTAYKNYILRQYKSIFRFATTYYRLPYNPSIVLTTFKDSFEEIARKRRKKEMSIRTEKEFRQFIKYVDNMEYKTLFIVLFYTGLRLGEAQALTWKDYNGESLYIDKSLTKKTEHGLYDIKDPKTASSIRKVALGDVSLILDNYKNEQMKLIGFDESWFIFGNVKPLAATSITRQKDIAIEKAKVKRITLHEFRHSHASILIASGIDIVAVSRRLGHSDIKMTLNTYAHLLEKNEEKLLQKINLSSQNLLTK